MSHVKLSQTLSLLRLDPRRKFMSPLSRVRTLRNVDIRAVKACISDLAFRSNGLHLIKSAQERHTSFSLASDFRISFTVSRSVSNALSTTYFMKIILFSAAGILWIWHVACTPIRTYAAAYMYSVCRATVAL